MVAAFASGVGLGASTFVKSPAQQAADRRAPSPSVLTAPVVRKVLATTLTMRADFVTGRRESFTPASVAPTAQGPAPSILITTGVFTSLGQRVAVGKPLLEFDERPVFVLPGAFPAYRDLIPGDSGKDVQQLQDGLRRLGFDSWDNRGYFGLGTQAVVRGFYESIHYAVPTTMQSPATAKGGRGSKASARVPYVPMSEVAFLPPGRAHVAAMTARVGRVVQAPFITFATGNLSLSAHLDPSGKNLVRVGRRVSIVSETTGFTAEATVGAVGQPKVAHGVSVLPVSLVRSTDWPLSEAGDNVRVTVTTASTTGPVLAVPVSALSATADGRTVVTVLGRGNRRNILQVIPGVSAGGLVEIRPVNDDIPVGTSVVTGQ